MLLSTSYLVLSFCVIMILCVLRIPSRVALAKREKVEFETPFCKLWKLHTRWEQNHNHAIYSTGHCIRVMISWFHDLLDFCFYADKVFAKATREEILSTQRLMITQKESTRYEMLRSKWLGVMLNNRKELGQRNESSCIFIIWKYLLWNAFFLLVFLSLVLPVMPQDTNTLSFVSSQSDLFPADFLRTCSPCFCSWRPC